MTREKAIAQERYEDLCEYFGESKDILKNRDDFKEWLDRVKWHIRKAEELYEKCFDGMTNGEVIKEIYRHHSDMNCGSNGEYIHVWSNDGKCQMTIHKDWWNAPYKAEKPETCKGCLEPCIMYEPDMRGCKKKVTERGEADGK